MHILLTGHDGYIGSHLKPYLEENGHKVTPYVGDIMDFNLDLFDEYEMVIHLAALTGVRKSIEDPEEYYRINVEGFSRVVDNCLQYRVKLLYASSSNAKEWWTNPYAVTKKMNEYLVSTTPNSFIGFRPHTVYPGRPDMLYDQLNKDPTNIEYINAAHMRDFTHIEDMCSGILTLAENYSIINDYVVDIGTGNAVSVLEVAKKFGWDGEIRRTATPQEREHTEADTTILKSFGWNPKHNIL